MIVQAGDGGFYVRLGDRIDPALSERVLATVAALDGERPVGVTDVVPGYAALLVTFDPGRADPQAIRRWIEGALSTVPAPPAVAARRTVELPVLYASSVAPDLEALAREKTLEVEELVRLHAAPLYRCYLLGFRPGFPFLGGLDAGLYAPRLATPRLRVPAGSVGIGGQQTGVYPVDSPGGWRIIGRTPLRLFDLSRPEPFLIAPGDSVRFVPIDQAEFDRRLSPWPPST